MHRPRSPWSRLQETCSARPGAHPFTPLGEEPALGAGPHVAVLNVVRPKLHVAFLVIDHVPDVAHTLHVSGPLSHSTGHRALKQQGYGSGTGSIPSRARLRPRRPHPCHLPPERTTVVRPPGWLCVPCTGVLPGELPSPENLTTTLSLRPSWMSCLLCGSGPPFCHL